MVCFFLTKPLTSGALASISVTLMLKPVFVTKPLTSGILISTAVSAELVAKPVILGILPSISVTLVLKSVSFNQNSNIKYFFVLSY